jgi:hypothetical protein
MSEIQLRVFWSVLVIVVPWLMFFIAAVVPWGDSLGPGVFLLPVFWVVGLAWVWWPRREKTEA